jgi:hypothetical protein
MSQAVIDYEAAWDAKQNKGSFVLKLDGGKRTKFTADNATEFIAILTLLQGEKQVFARPPYLATTP